MRLSAHRLLIKNPESTLDFYQNVLGMTLIRQKESKAGQHYWLSFDAKQAELELVYQTDIEFEIAPQPCKTEGYWKFTVAVEHLEFTRSQLLNKNVAIGPCFEVQDLAYLCHLTDPNGYCIELIQKTLKKPSTTLPCHHSFNLSTLRVKNAKQSVQFYESLGMRLVYTYRSDARQMTLYFLISKSDANELAQPSDQLIEEKLWQFPYTVLELQQLDGTAEDPNFHYRTDSSTGFLGLNLHCEKLRFQQLASSSLAGLTLNFSNTDAVECFDPDGYRLQIRRF